MIHSLMNWKSSATRPYSSISKYNEKMKGGLYRLNPEFWSPGIWETQSLVEKFVKTVNGKKTSWQVPSINILIPVASKH